MRLSELILIESKDALLLIPEKKVLINTINAHSFNVAQKDELFAEALQNGDYLIPDGASIVKACHWLKAKSQPKERITGWELFSFEMERLERKSEKDDSSTPSTSLGIVKSKVMFMGSSESVLAKIKEKAAVDYPNLEVVTYSPPYKAEFSQEDNNAIINAINEADPDLLWIGMTAPKQEKWTYQHWNELDIHCHVGTIGAVFDFYAGTVKRAPKWMQEHSFEWLYRLIKEPKRMWRRYLIGNVLFIRNMIMIG
jgi:N-acetylglucosaminyldiphosphoundecaprenol N-acetyl-beta-D-mannosaminyltransferase